MPLALNAQSLNHWTTTDLVTKSSLTLRIPWAVAQQAPLSMEFPRQAYCSGLPFSSQASFLPGSGDLPELEIGCISYTEGRFFAAEPSGKFPIYSLFDGHLASSYFLAIMNAVAMVE